MFSDDEGGLRKLRQPLMDGGGGSSSSDEDAAIGLLPHSPSSERGAGGASDASWATRRKRRRRKDDDDLGEVHAPRGMLLGGLSRAEPKLARTVGRWLLSISAAASLLAGGAAAKAKTSPRVVRSKRKADAVEDATERALAWMAGLTLALALLLVVTVAIQAS